MTKLTKFKKYVFVKEISYIATSKADALEQQQEESEGWYIKHQDFKFTRIARPSASEIQYRLDEIKDLDDYIESEDLKEQELAKIKCTSCGKTQVMSEQKDQGVTVY